MLSLSPIQNAGPLTFRPTYKFQPGTSTYEQRPEKKLRAPAWCDRILWRTAPTIDTRYFHQVRAADSLWRFGLRQDVGRSLL